MSRRDTIIVAVLVNAGLLIILFASALKSNSPEQQLAAAATSAIHTSSDTESPESHFKKEPTVAVGTDEVDRALKEWAQNAVAAAPSTPVTTPMTPSSFADDLKPISESPLAPQSAAPTAQTLVAPIAPVNKTTTELLEVKVKKGDVLEKIARQHHTTVSEIMKANKLANTNLRIGQVLKIPTKVIKKAEVQSIAYAPAAPATESQAQESGTKLYTVKKGDSPWTIAVKNHMKVEDLLKLNNMSEEQARRLKPGDQLRIQ